jgi:hypothetical protein
MRPVVDVQGRFALVSDMDSSGTAWGAADARAPSVAVPTYPDRASNATAIKAISGALFGSVA